MPQPSDPRTLKPVQLRLDESPSLYDASGQRAAEFQRLSETVAPALHEMLLSARVVLRPNQQAVDASPAAQPSEPPLGAAAWMQLAGRAWIEYQADQQRSGLARALRLAETWRHEVDLVIVIGDAPLLAAPKALMRACCHPYHNQLSRGERGSRPRMIFAGDQLDNDAVQGLLDLVRGGGSTVRDHCWGLVLLSQQPWTAESRAVARLMWNELMSSAGGAADDCHCHAAWVIGEAVEPEEITGREVLGERFTIPASVPGALIGLSSAGLVPAALLGLDILRLLRGAVTMNAHATTADAESNLVLRLAVLNRLWNDQLAASGPPPKTRHDGYELRAWLAALEGLAAWHHHLMPADDKRPVINLVVDRWRCDTVPADPDSSLPELAHAARRHAARLDRQADRPYADLYLPRLDEQTLGELLQLLMLASHVAIPTGG